METATSNGRKEIFRLNGLTILVGMAVIANLLVVGIAYRWHNYQFFVSEKEHNVEYRNLYRMERAVKDEVVRLEGVASWNETAYVRALGKNFEDTKWDMKIPEIQGGTLYSALNNVGACGKTVNEKSIPVYILSFWLLLS